MDDPPFQHERTYDHKGPMSKTNPAQLLWTHVRDVEPSSLVSG
jgi:hypothetical protein